MPLSNRKHALPYAPAPDQTNKLRDIVQLVRLLQRMDIPTRLKKVMLDRAIWMVVEHTGNFLSRYRSKETTEKIGEPIQRDHVHTRKSLVAQLLDGATNVEEIVAKAQCCIVTKTEHARLSRVGAQHTGWDRYRAAVPPVEVFDMETGKKVV